MLVRPSGSVMVLNEEQPMNAALLMLVRPWGSVMLLNEEQPSSAW
jgi:hypothetical protein